jgi:hypothetical protein
MFDAYKVLAMVEIKRASKRSMSTKFWHIILLILFLFFPVRYKAITLLYAWFRKTDDVIDGEEHTPPGYDICSYIEQKQDLIDAKDTFLLDEDKMYLWATRALSQRGIDLSEEIQDLFLAMKKEYLNKGKFPKRAEIESKILLQDRAVLMMLVKVHSKHYKPLDPVLFDFFTRVDALMDIEEDIEKGIINIPYEDALEMGIDPRSLPSFGGLIKNHHFKKWYLKELDKAILKSIKIKKIMEERRELFLLKVIFDILDIKKRLELLKQSPFLFL